jgi:hypothetical protein
LPKALTYISTTYPNKKKSKKRLKLQMIKKVITYEAEIKIDGKDFDFFDASGKFKKNKD